jgi:hypothetical protein
VGPDDANTATIANGQSHPVALPKSRAARFRQIDAHQLLALSKRIHQNPGTDADVAFEKSG